MSSCLSGGGRAAYGFDLEIVKSPSSTSTTRTASHNTPSPSSTLSESNSPLTISTRKPRTARKRLNQTYNEAAALLSTAYPNIFSTKNISAKKNSSNSQPRKFFGINQHQSIDFDESSDLLFPFGTTTDEHSSDLFFHPPIESKTDLFFPQKVVNFGEKEINGVEIDDSEANLMEPLVDLDAESILDEEMEEGIDSIMGNAGSNGEENNQFPFNRAGHYHQGRLGQMMMNSWYGYPIGIGVGGNVRSGFGLRSALRHNDDANWWRFPTVDFDQISPRFHRTTNNSTNSEGKKGVVECNNVKKKPFSSSEKKKKKKKKKVAEKPPAEGKGSETDQNPVESKSGLLLKLNYDGVLDAWSDKASPFPDEILGSDGAGTDMHGRVAQIDLFGEGGVREASVLRYKEKRRTRLFSNSKKIRYQVRKLNADQRPRIKGRFVRRPNATNPSCQS